MHTESQEKNIATENAVLLFLSSNQVNNLSNFVGYISTFFSGHANLKKDILLRAYYVIYFVDSKIILSRKHVLQEHPDSKVTFVISMTTRGKTQGHSK